MREVLALRAPELTPSVEWPGSPRTFARFTRRSSGAVGGAARVLRWRAWVDVGPQRVAPRVWLVGDSVFPGQSTLATAVGGVRVAEAVRRALGPGSPG
jgi:phytoene dehydrogenase-like protein